MSTWERGDFGAAYQSVVTRFSGFARHRLKAVTTNQAETPNLALAPPASGTGFARSGGINPPARQWVLRRERNEFRSTFELSLQHYIYWCIVMWVTSAGRFVCAHFWEGHVVIASILILGIDSFHNPTYNSTANSTHHSTHSPTHHQTHSSTHSSAHSSTHHSTTFSTKFLRVSKASGKSGRGKEMRPENEICAQSQKLDLVWFGVGSGDWPREQQFWKSGRVNRKRLGSPFGEKAPGVNFVTSSLEKTTGQEALGILRTL
jgi:hypothetical protein